MFTYTCRCKPEEDRAKKLANVYKPPSNIPNLVTPRTNSDVWDLLNKGHRAVDVGVQHVQTMQTHALTSIVNSYSPAAAQTLFENAVFVSLPYGPPDKTTPEEPHLSVTVQVVSAG